MDIKPIVRDEHGLVTGIDYPQKPDGYIDWRGVIPNEYLYVNPQWKDQIEKRYNKKIEDIKIDEDKVADSDLVITLAGIKYLLRLRGYTKVNYEIKEANSGYAGVNCIIEFIPNFETENKVIVYSDSACAYPGNTKSFGQYYLLEIATNRAFCRTVRSFLNINIVSKEELGTADVSSQNFDSMPSSELLLPKLKEQMTKFGYTFDQIKAKLVKQEPAAEAWSKLEELPSKWIVWCIERIDQKNKSIAKKS